MTDNDVIEDISIQERIKRRRSKLEENQKEVLATKNQYFIAKDDLMNLQESYGTEPTEDLLSLITLKQKTVHTLKNKIEQYNNNIKEMKDLLSMQDEEGKLNSNNNNINNENKNDFISSLFTNEKGIKLLPSYPKYKRNESATEFIKKFQTNVLPTLSERDRKNKIMSCLICLVVDINQQAL
jgi:hypothetical protein